MPRSTRRTAPTQPLVSKENQTDHRPSAHEVSMSSRKARHRLSATELARLEGVFKQETHPTRQKKKDLAAELGMDYKTVTIWFQNKRQTSKRGQLLAEGTDARSSFGRTRADSCLRSVSSPSHNATLDARVDPTTSLENKAPGGIQLNTVVASHAIVRIKPLLDSLNALTSRTREDVEIEEAKDEAPNIKDIDRGRLQTPSENAIASTEFNAHDQIAEQEQTTEKPVGWKRIRTLEWACERQAKRRKLSREGYVRLGSEEVQDGEPNGTHMDSALSLLSLASSSTQAAPTKDVVRGASLLLSFKYSWRRK